MNMCCLAFLSTHNDVDCAPKRFVPQCSYCSRPASMCQQCLRAPTIVRSSPSQCVCDDSCRVFIADDDIGVSRADLTVPVDGAPRAPFWGQFTNPALTLAALRELPKADLHCRFDGSMSPRWLWSQMGDDPSRWLRDADLGITADDFDAFRVTIFFFFFMFRNNSRYS